MLDKVRAYAKEVEQFSTTSADELENFRLKFLSKKGIMNQLFAAFKDVPVEEKKDFAKNLSGIKERKK